MSRLPTKEQDARRSPHGNGHEFDATSLNLREPPGQTDLANAKRLIRDSGADIRYCQGHGCFYHFERRWKRDTTRTVEALAKRTAEQVFKDVGRQLGDVGSEQAKAMLKFALYTASDRGIRAMLNLAKSDPSISVTPDDFDQHELLFNVENGTIDLSKVRRREPRREDLITAIAPVRFDENASCPTWRQFVRSIFAGNENLISYVQRLLGYSLTGSVRDHILPMPYGTGANGKSTLLNTVIAIAGPDYSMQASSNLLLAKPGQHPTEQADLAGKRFVLTSESGDGRQLAEEFCKRATGGDRIRARWCRQDSFEFSPTHKLWLSTNHKPTIKGQDFGIWRRVKLIPFSVTFPEDQQDKRLPEKLLTEASGILNWLILGAAQWHADGLQEPAEVTEATRCYRNAMDVLGQFLEEHCVFESDTETKASDVRNRYETWCKESGEKPVSGRRFGEYITDRGVTKHTANGTYYTGIALR